jgi:hypothetical protein
MNNSVRARLLAAALTCLCISFAWAEEPPVDPAPPIAESAAGPESVATPPEPVQALPETAPAPAETAVPTTETPPAEATAAALAPRTGAKRILVLPVEFTVYEKSVAGVEAVPEWTETAKFSLGDAASEMLRQDDRFQIVALPQIDGEPAALLREHVELFKIVAGTVTGVVQFGKVWEDKRSTNFDYSIGNGLAFLADTADADFAFILGGSQIKQTGGSVFMQVLAAAGGVGLPGGGTYVMGGIVDLRTGELRWLNARMGSQVFGITGSDVRKPETAREIIVRMFEGFPQSQYAAFRPF